MLTLNDGRSELWQWDTGRTLTVHTECSQVHFSNNVFGRSIDVDVVGGTAIIPDVLLQTDKDLNVWAFVGTAENGYTKISKTFKVNRRNKPADYVFTPQEQITLKDAISIVETAKSAANDAIESAKQAEASADNAAKIADEMKKLDDQVEKNTETATKAKADALTAQAKAEEARNAAETAKKAAEDAANSAGTDASAASAAATRAENAANDAAAELDTIRSLYQEMQEYVSQSIQDVQTEGNTQVQRVAEEGAAQIAAAKEQADRADVAKEAAENAAASAQTVAGAIQAESEQIGKNTVDIASLQTQMYQNAPGIVEAAEGKTIALDDSSDKPLQGLTIYGMTTQNGTPMPDAPVELVSVGDGGSLNTIVCRKNLFADGKVYLGAIDRSYGKIYIVEPVESPVHREAWGGVGIRVAVSPNNTYTVSSDITPCRYFTVTFYKEFDSVGSKANAISFKEFKNINNATFTTPENCYCVVITSVSNVESDFTWSWWQVEHGSAETVYEPYEGQTLSISTPNGLPGIPVTSGGNYTDANGQQWICDEVDFGKGVYVQRVGRINSYNGESIGSVYLSSTGDLNAGATVLYPLSAPIETALSAEELAAYAALHTNYPNTTVYNDGGAGMEVKYVADTKLYVDKKFAELSAALLNQ